MDTDAQEYSENEFRNVDYSNSDISNKSFWNCTFADCDFTDLQKANFIDAKGYDIDPMINTIRKAKFSAPEALNLLNGFQIDIT